MKEKEEIFSFSNIYSSYEKCKRSKSNTTDLLLFQTDLIENLWSLKNDLDNRKYKISKSICFLANSPKLREIFAASFRDRVVHHILVSRLESLYEPKFIYDVYNNRANKGTHKAVKRAKDFMQKNLNSYYLQLDIVNSSHKCNT